MSNYKENILAERQGLVRKYLYSQVRVMVKVSGTKAAHLDKLYKYNLRVGY